MFLELGKWPRAIEIREDASRYYPQNGKNVHLEITGRPSLDVKCRGPGTNAP